MGESNYLLDRDRRAARQRLQAVERVEDPATIARLERLALGAGGRCLEVGAGAGSVARWLAERVGPAGRVVALDLQTDLLDLRDRPWVEVRQGDVATASIEQRAYDLVHARNVLVHVPARERALARMAAAVRPGGWILLEEPDLVADGPDPSAAGARADLYRRGTAAVFDYLTRRGLDLHLGGRLHGLLVALGFAQVEAEGLAVTYRGGNPDQRSPHGQAFASLRDAVVADGALRGEEFDRFLALYDDPSFAWREGLRVLAWGRCP